MARARITPKLEPLPVRPTIMMCDQGTEEWFRAHIGVPSASNFGTIMADGKDGGPSKTRTELLYRMAGEIITGDPAEDTYKSRAMLRGKEMEPAARADYAERTGSHLLQVGFIVNFTGLHRCGCSPDALVDFDGGLETKTMRPDLMIPLLLKGATGGIAMHRAQVQGCMHVTGREWWDLKIYWPKMPNFTVRIYRDEVYIRELRQQIERFNYELGSLVERLRKMGAT